MKIVKNKRFLSEDRHDETGSITYFVEKGTENYSVIQSTVKIYDCNRSISLDFDCYDYQEIDERLNKIDVLVEELTKVRDALASCKKGSKFYY